jgi:hypothetical protein
MLVWSGHTDGGALSLLDLLENTGDERPEDGWLSGSITVGGRQVRAGTWKKVSSPTSSSSPPF